MIYKFHHGRKKNISMLVLLILIAFLGSGFSRFQMNFSLKNLYSSEKSNTRQVYEGSAPSTLDIEALSKINNDQVFILLNAPDLFNLENMLSIQRLQEDLLRELPYLQHLYSPLSGWLQTLTNEQELEDWLAAAQLNPLINGELLSHRATGDEFLIIIDLEPFHLQENEIRSASFTLGAKLEEILESYQSSPFKIYSAGSNIIEYQLNKEVLRNSARTIALGFIIAIILSIVLLRNGVFSLGTLLVLVLGELSCFGLFSWLGYKTDANFVLIPLIIGFIVCICNSIHLHSYFKKFYRQDRADKTEDKAMDYALQQCFKPMLFTAITTIAGSVSFSLVEIEVLRWMGIATSAMIAFMFIYSLLLLPSVVYRLAKSKHPAYSSSSAASKKIPYERLWVVLAVYTHKLKYPILITFSLLLVVAIILLPKLNINLDRQWMMGNRLNYMQELQHFSDSDLSAEDYYILILGFDGDPLATDELSRLGLLSKELAKLPYVEKLNSLSSLLEVYNSYRNQELGLPATRALANGLVQLLRRPPLSLNMDNFYFSGEKSYYRLSIGLNKYDSIFLHAHLDEVEDLLKQYFPQTNYPNLSFTVEGSLIDFANMNDTVSLNLLRSLGLSLLLIFVLLSLFFRDIKTSLIAMIPNISPIIIIGILMWLNETPIDFLLMCVGPIVLGLAVDDSIYFISYLKERLAKADSYLELHKNALLNIGSALTKTSLISCGLFASFMFSGVRNIFFLGLYCSLGMLFALVSDLFITPLLFQSANKR